MTYKHFSQRPRGFTIIEFMVATTVFSVVLLSVSAAVVYMGRAYQRSTYASSTQDATSNLVDTISQAIKFSADQVTIVDDNDPMTTDTLCVGNRQFLYVIGRQLGNSDPQTGSQHVVMTRPNENCTIQNIISATPGPTAKGAPHELMGQSMRLDRLTVTSSGGIWKITARVAFGDDDLFCNDQVTGSCSDTAVLSDTVLLSNDPQYDLVCRSNIGSQFCSVSELSNSIYRRL